MTDRIKGFIVTLDRDIREDDVEPIRQALRMVRCVASVQDIKFSSDDDMARSRVRAECALILHQKIDEILYPELNRGAK